MTPPPADDEIKELAKSYPAPAEVKMNRRIGLLVRMVKFYESKIPEAPDKQSQMFSGFVDSLAYAITTIKMYRKLTKRLAELAEDDGTIRNSKH